MTLAEHDFYNYQHQKNVAIYDSSLLKDAIEHDDVKEYLRLIVTISQERKKYRRI